MVESVAADHTLVDTCADGNLLAQALVTTFADSALFHPSLVWEGQYLKMSRLHARVCGLLARIGVQNGLLVDVGRSHPIDPVVKPSRRAQHQAEADVTFVDIHSDTPVMLIEYETGDAPISKMRSKFPFLDSFAKHSSTVKVVAFLVTVTHLQHTWEKETQEEREAFVLKEIPRFVTSFFAHPHNAGVSFVFGVFRKDHIEVRVYDRDGTVAGLTAQYASADDRSAG